MEIIKTYYKLVEFNKKIQILCELHELFRHRASSLCVDSFDMESLSASFKSTGSLTPSWLVDFVSTQFAPDKRIQGGVELANKTISDNSKKRKSK